MAKKNFSYSSNTYEGGGYKGSSSTDKKSLSSTSKKLMSVGAARAMGKVNTNVGKTSSTTNKPTIKKVTPNRSGRTTTTTTARPAQIKKKIY